MTRVRDDTSWEREEIEFVLQFPINFYQNILDRISGRGLMGKLETEGEDGNGASDS